MKKRLLFFLKLIIGCVLLAVVFWVVDLHSVTELLGRVHLGYYLLSLAIFFLCWLVNTMKWQLILAGLRCDVDFWTLLKFNFSSFYFALVLPGGQATGELIKCYRVAKTGDNKLPLILSVFMDRLTGLAGSVTLGIIGLIFSATVLPNRGALLAVSITFALLAAIFLGLLFFPWINHWLVRLLKFVFSFSWFKNKFEPQAITKAGETFKGSYGMLAIAFVFSLAFQVLGTICVHYLALSLGMAISFLDLLWVYSLVSIVLLLPVSLMGLGLREGSFVGLLALLAIPGYAAVSLSLLVFTVNLFAALCGGFMELAHYLVALPNGILGKFGMKINFKKIKKIGLVLALLLLWMFVHWPILKYGTSNLPLTKSYVGDEQSPIVGALRIARDKNLFALKNATAVHYGPVFSAVVLPALALDYVEKYVSHQVANAEDYKNKVEIDWGPLLFDARLIAALFSFLTLLGFWKLLNIFDEKGSYQKLKWLLMLILALNAHFFIYSALLRHWIFVLFVGVWLSYYAYRLKAANRKTDWLMFLIISLFGFGISNVSILYQVVLLPLLYPKIRAKDFAWLKNALEYVFFLILGAAFLIYWHPYVYLVTASVYGTFMVETQASSQYSFLYYLQVIFLNQPFLVLSFALLFGLVFAKKLFRDSWFWITLLPTLAFFLALGLPSRHEPRYALPMILGVILFVAWATLKLFSLGLSKKIQIILVALLALEICFQSVNLLGWLRLIGSGLAEERIIAQILAQPANTKTLMKQDGLLGGSHTADSLARYKNVCSASWAKLDEYINLKYPVNAKLLNVDYYCNNQTTSGLSLEKYDYIITFKGVMAISNFFEDNMIRIWDDRDLVKYNVCEPKKNICP